MKRLPTDTFVVFKVTTSSDWSHHRPKVGLVRNGLVYVRTAALGQHIWHGKGRKLSDVTVVREASPREVEIGIPLGWSPPLRESTREKGTP